MKKKGNENANDPIRGGNHGTGVFFDEPKEGNIPGSKSPEFGNAPGPESGNTPSPGPESGGEKVTLDSLAAHVESQAPAPNLQAIERAVKKRGPYVKSGKYAKGNKHGGKTETVDSAGSVSVSLSDAEKERYIRCYQAGAESVEGLVTFASQTLGDEWGWQPAKTIEITLPDGKKSKIQISERDRGRDAWGRAYAYKNWEGPNPLVSMFLWSLGYAAVRLNQPETKKKALGFFQKIKAKLDEMRKKRNAHPGSGHNRIGENVPGEKVS